MSARRSFPLTLAVVLAALASIWALWGGGQCPAPLPPQATELTFFTPDGYREELARATRLGQINVYSHEGVRESLEIARRHGARLQLDFGPALLRQRPPERQRHTYQSGAQALPKSFAPLPVNQVKDMADDDDLARTLAPFLPVLQEYREHIAAIFLADEPYMHSISRQEMERAARTMRRILRENGLENIKLGIVFAGAMFDPEFAAMIAHQADIYVDGVEEYYERVRGSSEGREWAEHFSKSRLITYDQAGNFYTDGGIPQGYDIIAYDLYTATLLLDALHTRTLDWFARLGISPACRRFKGTNMPQTRANLSFFQNGPVKPLGQLRDRPLLDDIFSCKSESMLHLLRKHMHPGSALQLWGEASANGFFEFNKRGRMKTTQPKQLIAERVRDEVLRTLNFYDLHRGAFSAGIVFFTWEDTRDGSIDLNIMGARSLHGVPDLVFERVGKAPATPRPTWCKQR